MTFSDPSNYDKFRKASRIYGIKPDHGQQGIVAVMTPFREEQFWAFRVGNAVLVDTNDVFRQLGTSLRQVPHGGRLNIGSKPTKFQGETACQYYESSQITLISNSRQAYVGESKYLIDHKILALDYSTVAYWSDIAKLIRARDKAVGEQSFGAWSFRTFSR